jgi:glycosyltransferase involved in cell wall biosynthesis
LKTLIAIPCFNESEVIDECIESIRKNFTANHDILVVNDGSSDNSLDKIRKSKVEFVLSSLSNFGLSAVFNSILTFAKDNSYDFLIVYDSDMQYPENQIDELFNKLVKTNKDIVIGERNFNNENHFSKTKIFFQKLGSSIISKLVGSKLKDVTSGFRGYSRSAIHQLHVVNKYTYTIETLLQCKIKNLTIGTMPLNFFRETRTSRLVKSSFDYIKKTVGIVYLGIFLYFRNKVVFYSLSAILILSITTLSRFFIPYFRTGYNTGNIQSLIFGTFLILFLLLIAILLNQNLINYRIETLNSIIERNKHSLIER